MRKNVKKIVIQLSKNILLHNVNRTKYKKNALLIYITKPFVKKQENVSHPNYFRALIISKVLDELGYNVDVIYSEFTRNINMEKYNVVIGMGNGYVRSIEKCNAWCKKIYLATGTSFTVANQAELIRWINLFRRGKGFIGADRIERVDEPIKALASLYCSNAIITTADNEWVLDSFRSINSKIYPIGAMPLINDKMEYFTRQISVGRKGFLFLCGNGCIHKGLDIIVETFCRRKDLYLYVCGNVEEEFVKVYKDELSNGNIILKEFVNINSYEFAEICSKCCFIVNMSCSEGCCTSVLTGMAVGLIPIITKAEGINLSEDTGFMIESADAKELGGCLDYIEGMGNAEIEEKMERAKIVIKQKYTMESCEIKLKQYLSEILC